MKVWLLTTDTANQYKRFRYRQAAKKLGISLEEVSESRITIQQAETVSVFLDGILLTVFPDVIISLVIVEKLYPHAIRVLEQLAEHSTVCNPITAFRVANDKLNTYSLLQSINIPFPKIIQFNMKKNHYSQLNYHLGSPFLLKSNKGFRGKGIELVHNQAEFEDFIMKNEFAFYFAQQYLPESKGSDVRLLMFQSELIGAISRTAADGSIFSNSYQGSTAKQVTPEPAMVKAAQKVMQALGLYFGSVDFIFDGEQYVVCEVNAGPGFEQFEAVTKIDVAVQVLSGLFSLVAAKE